MLKKFLLATVCVAGLSSVGPLAAAYADEAPLTTEQQQALDAQVSAVEALVIQYQNDPDGLQAAIQALVTNSADPEVAGNAVLVVFTNSQNPTITAILANNAGVKSAGGKGLGAAIVVLGLTNPDLASRMTANVTANGGSTFVADVQTGSDTQTASLNQNNNNNNNNNNNTTKDSTPEQAASQT